MFHPRTERFIALAERNGALCTVSTQHGHFGDAERVHLSVGMTRIGVANFDATTGDDLGYWSRRSGSIAGSNEVTRAALIARIRRTAALTA